MKQLYCPWRKDYSDNVSKNKSEDAPPEACVFCKQFKENTNDQHFILKRFVHNVIILNKYPYNAGHLMIIPYEHISDLAQLSPEAQTEMIKLVSKSTVILREVIDANGINLGMNLGIVGGAGIPSHIHMHIIPRYQGDTNFLATIGDTKHISYDLQEMFAKLKPHFER